MMNDAEELEDLFDFRIRQRLLFLFFRVNSLTQYKRYKVYFLKRINDDTILENSNCKNIFFLRAQSLTTTPIKKMPLFLLYFYKTLSIP